MKIKSTINKFACQWSGCGLIFEQPEPLYKHLTEDHIGRKVTGNLCLTCHWGNCKVSVEKRDHITSHVRVHVPFKPHECPICGKSFKRPQDLKKHDKLHNEFDEDLTKTGQESEPEKPYDSFLLQAPFTCQDSLKVPISPPQSTAYSDDSWLYSGSTLSPATENYTNFQNTSSPYMNQDPSSSPSSVEEKLTPIGTIDPVFTNSGDILFDMMYTDNSQLKTDYDTEMINNLDVLDNIINIDNINADSLKIKNDQQLEDFNIWLNQLTETIDDNLVSMEPCQNPYYGEYEALTVEQTSYTDMLLQFDASNMEIEEEKVQYPNTNEQDMYIRSLPMEQPQQEPQEPQQQEFSPPSELNNNVDLSANMQIYEYQPFDINNKTGITGYKNHFNTIPDIITNDIFIPQIQTAINFGTTEDSVVYKPSQETPDNAEEEEKEDQMTENSRQSPAKKSAIHKDVLDLLVSDLSGLAIDKDAVQTDQTEQLKKHQRLLKQLGEAINQSYSKKSSLDSIKPAVRV